MRNAIVCGILIAAALAALPAISSAGIAVQEKPAAKPEPYYPPELQETFRDVRRCQYRKTTEYYKSPAPVPHNPCGAFAPNSRDPFGFGPPGCSYDFTAPGMLGWVWFAGWL